MRAFLLAHFRFSHDVTLAYYLIVGTFLREASDAPEGEGKRVCLVD